MGSKNPLMSALPQSCTARLELDGQPVNGAQCSHLRPVPIAPAQEILRIEGLPSPRAGEVPPRLLDGGDASRAPLALPVREPHLLTSLAR